MAASGGVGGAWWIGAGRAASSDGPGHASGGGGVGGPGVSLTSSGEWQ